MKTKRENPLKVLFSFSGEARGKMTGSVILAFIGEMFGMAPYFVVTLLAKELYEGTATVERAAVMAVTAAVCMCLRAWLTGLSSMRSHTVSFTILKNIRCALADKMAKVPMGVMLETPSGTFKTLMVDNVGRLEDIIAHMVPELPSNLAGPVFSIILVFVLDWRMGLAAFITVPLSLVFAVCMMRGYKEKMAVYLRSGNEMNAALVEYVGGIQVIKAFGQGSKSFGEFSRSVNFFHDSTLDGGLQGSAPLHFTGHAARGGVALYAGHAGTASVPGLHHHPLRLYGRAHQIRLCPGAAFLHGSQPGPHSGLPRHAGAAPA